MRPVPPSPPSPRRTSPLKPKTPLRYINRRVLRPHIVGMTHPINFLTLDPKTHNPKPLEIRSTPNPLQCAQRTKSRASPPGESYVVDVRPWGVGHVIGELLERALEGAAADVGAMK